MAKSVLPDLSPEQNTAFELLLSGENAFITGGAGSGKSFLIRHYLRGIDSKQTPILASTGAAAVLLGGRTFHSFFGLGIMEGGAQAALEKGRKDGRLMKRLSSVEGVIIDEISMIPRPAFEVAEALARQARGNQHPWGGMRMVLVGDFAQLPPVTRSGTAREWSFLSDIWQQSGFQTCLLNHNQRVTEDSDFLEVLADVRAGTVTQRVRNFLESRSREHDEDDKSTRLFPRRDQSEYFNQRELLQISKPEVRIPSIYLGEARAVEILKKSAPIPAELVLKEGARVMFLQNDTQKRWINGTRGTVVEVHPEKIVVQKETGREVQVEKSQFVMQDADGKIVASVINFPLNLAYATTIHKSQGCTLDDLWVDLSRLWEPGQAYVALSRLRSGKGLRLLGWSPSSFITDPQVTKFYTSLSSSSGIGLN